MILVCLLATFVQSAEPDLVLLERKSEQLSQKIHVAESAAADINKKIIQLASELNRYQVLGDIDNGQKRISTEAQINKLREEQNEILMQISLFKSEYELVHSQLAE